MDIYLGWNTVVLMGLLSVIWRVDKMDISMAVMMVTWLVNCLVVLLEIKQQVSLLVDSMGFYLVVVMVFDMVV
jgi:hypothetical protein